MKRSTHILHKKKAFSKLYCQEMINCFESSSQQCAGNSGVCVNRSIKNSVDVGFDIHDPFNPLTNTLEMVLDLSFMEYGQRWPLAVKTVVPWRAYKKANIQKYYPKCGYIREHCEYDLTDPCTARRILAWMVYLNDVTDKGGTHFTYQNITTKPRTGDLYVWPAYFTHAHYGIPSPTQVKYIATGWCSFDEFSTTLNN